MVSGLTVMIALAGLFLTGYSVFTGIALGTIAVVGVTVLGSLTVLPALLSWLGRWADRGRIPFLGRRRTASKPSRLWAALVRQVVRRPAVWGGLGVPWPCWRWPRPRWACGWATRPTAGSRQPAGDQDARPDPAGVPAGAVARRRSWSPAVTWAARRCARP